VQRRSRCSTARSPGCAAARPWSSTWCSSRWLKRSTSPSSPPCGYEFKHDLDAYPDALPGDQSATLAELIAFNIRNGSRVLAVFGQELFEQAEATSGDLGDASYQAARGDTQRLACGAVDNALISGRLARGRPAVRGARAPQALGGQR
jgi:hypothetical protein